MILNARPHRMLLNIFVSMSIRVTQSHLLGLDRSPLFCTGTIWPLCPSSKSVSSHQYVLNKWRRWVTLSVLSALKTFGGTLFCHGALLFVNFVTFYYSSSHEMGWSISCMTYLCLTSSSVYQSSERSAQKTLNKCSPSTEEFSASAVAVLPSGSHILMMMGLFCWILSPTDSILTLFHSSLGLKCMEWILSDW